MRYKQVAYFRALILAAVFTINHSHAQTGGFAVTQRGADWRVLSKTTVEHGTNRIHQYTELKGVTPALNKLNLNYKTKTNLI